MQTAKRSLILVAALTLGGCNTLNINNTSPELTRTEAGAIDAPARSGASAAETIRVSELRTPTPASRPSPEWPSIRIGKEAAQPSSDLMDRVRSGFRLRIPDNRRIESQISWYASHQEYLDRVQERAAPYLHFIVEETEKRNMPTELALLPIVESGFQPFAYSPGRAAGLWQFIPSTGKHYGLKQNWWYDGRRDVVAATRAALDYLNDLAGQFDGDWELALASYNAGAGTVQRAIKRNQKRGKGTDFWSLDLPRETMGYVPRLLAVAKVVAEPNAHGISLAPIPNQPHFEPVAIGSQLDLALAAEMADIPIEEIYRLNPGFNRWATAPDGPHRLSIPVEKATRFRNAVAELAPEKRLRWQRYRIRRGDNLGSIARKHKTTVALLQQINNLNGYRIRAGRHLLIPVAAKGLEQYTHTADARRQRTQNRDRSGDRITYRVRSGDTLWEIARRHGVSHKALARWNGMSPRDTLRLNQKLVIWKQKTSRNNELAALNLDTSPPLNTRSKLRYRVRKGDSLSRIAQRFNVSVSDLRRWNSLDGGYLQPGQRLQLFVDVTEQTL